MSLLEGSKWRSIRTMTAAPGLSPVNNGTSYVVNAISKQTIKIAGTILRGKFLCLSRPGM
jgi:hypothetical protein